jgi:multiple sugar transport system permease protein
MSVTSVKPEPVERLSRGAGGPPQLEPTRRGRRRVPSEAAFGMLLLSPAIGLILLVAVVPIGLAIYYSLHETSYLQVGSFVGVENFVELFGDDRFHNSLLASIKYVVGSLALALLISLPLAASLTASSKTTSVIRAIIFLPWVISQVVTALLWVWLLNPSFGPVSALLGAAGLPPIDALSSPDTAIVVVIVANVWASYPLATVLLLAAMQSVPDELYDAAAMDGCGPWKSFVHVTLPSIRSALGMTAINLTVYYFNMVTLIYTMTGGGPLRSTEMLSLRIYLEAFQNNQLASASAYGVIALLLNIAFATAYIRIMRNSGNN